MKQNCNLVKLCSHFIRVNSEDNDSISSSSNISTVIIQGSLKGQFLWFMCLSHLMNYLAIYVSKKSMTKLTHSRGCLVLVLPFEPFEQI